MKDPSTPRFTTTSPTAHPTNNRRHRLIPSHATSAHLSTHQRVLMARWLGSSVNPTPIVHFAHQRVSMNRWCGSSAFSTLTAHLCPPTSPYGSLVGIYPELHPSPPICAHQRVVMTRWWLSSTFPAIAAHLQPRSHERFIVALWCGFSAHLCPPTSPYGSLVGFLPDLHPSPPICVHQRVVMTRWWLSSTYPAIAAYLQPRTCHCGSLVWFYSLFHPDRLPLSTNESL